MSIIAIQERDEVHIRRQMIAASLSLLALSFCGVSHAQTRIGRYTTVANHATQAQIDPLMAVAQYKFSPRVKSVGGAMNIVLENTGYALAAKDILSKEAELIMQKPLPLTNRVLGPMSVKETLEVLMGKDVFNFIKNPLNRTINFKVKPEIYRAFGVHGHAKKR